MIKNIVALSLLAGILISCGKSGNNSTNDDTPKKGSQTEKDKSVLTLDDSVEVHHVKNFECNGLNIVIRETPKVPLRVFLFDLARTNQVLAESSPEEITKTLHECILPELKKL